MVPTGKNMSLGMTIFIASSKGTSRSTAAIGRPQVRPGLFLKISFKNEAEPCFPFVGVNDVHTFQTPEVRRTDTSGNAAARQAFLSNSSAAFSNPRMIL